MAKYIEEVFDFDTGEGISSVECDECGESIDVDSCNYSAINEYIKDNGWIVTNINGEWYEFCCRECLDRYRKGNYNPRREI